MKRTIAIVLFASAAGFGQSSLPEGSQVRVRLEQQISSATATTGSEVELTVTEDVMVGEKIFIAQGSRAVGSIIEAQSSRRMGRSGKLNFSIERVRGIDGKYVRTRYTPETVKGSGRGLATGAVAVGVGIVFLPAAPVALLIKGKDVTLPRGSTYTIYTDGTYTPRPTTAETPTPAATAVTPASAPQPQAAPPAPATGGATLSINSAEPGADIEVNDAFVGNTPTKINLTPGAYRIVVKSASGEWRRNLQVTAGSDIALTAVMARPQTTASTLLTAK